MISKVLVSLCEFVETRQRGKPLDGTETGLLLRVPVYGIVHLDPEGAVTQVTALKGLQDRRIVLAPRGRRRTSGIKADALLDKSEYTLGIYNGAFGAVPFKRLENKRHEKYKAGVEKWNEVTAYITKEGGALPQGAKAVSAFFARHDPDHPDPKLLADFRGRTSLNHAGGNVTFQVGDHLVIDIPEVRAALKALALKDISREDGICMVTGTFGPIMSGLDPVKGVPKTNKGGAYLISNNFRSAEPFGLQGNVKPTDKLMQWDTYDPATQQTRPGSNQVSTIGFKTARRVTGAVEYMLGQGRNDHCHIFGNAAFLVFGDHLTMSKVSETLNWQLEDPPEPESEPRITEADVDEDDDEDDAFEDVPSKLDAALRSEEQIALKQLRAPVDDGGYEGRASDVCILGLEGAESRISICYFHRESATDVLAHIACWRDQTEFGAGKTQWDARVAFENQWRPTVASLTRSLVPVSAGTKVSESTKNRRSVVARRLIHCIYDGGLIPNGLKHTALHRVGREEFPGRSGNRDRLNLYGLLGAAELRKLMMERNYTMSQAVKAIEDDVLFRLGQSQAQTEHAQARIMRAQRADGQPAIARWRSYVASNPAKGLAKLEAVLGIAYRNRFMFPKHRLAVQQRMRELWGNSVSSDTLPATAKDCSKFYLGYHAEEKRLWEADEAARLARKAANSTGDSNADEIDEDDESDESEVIALAVASPPVLRTDKRGPKSHRAT